MICEPGGVCRVDINRARKFFSIGILVVHDGGIFTGPVMIDENIIGDDERM